VPPALVEVELATEETNQQKDCVSSQQILEQMKAAS